MKEVAVGIPSMQKMESRFLIYRTGKMKSCNNSPLVFFTKKLLPNYLSVRKPYGNMFTISMKNFMSVTGWKPLTNISEDRNCRLITISVQSYYYSGLHRP